MRKRLTGSGVSVVPWHAKEPPGETQQLSPAPSHACIHSTSTPCMQVFILDSLVSYDTHDPKDAEKVVERVLPRLQHVNSAVVLSAVKVRGFVRVSIQLW